MAGETYIGDGVYAEPDEFGGVILRTRNGRNATNTIYLEPEVLAAFFAWIKRQADLSLVQRGDQT